MRISWGWKIAALYVGFVTMIVCLIVASSHQNIDLVSKDYYKDEISYQSVLDASRNQAALAGTFSVHANASIVTIEFPQEFEGKAITGSILFYSAINKNWDRTIPIVNGRVTTIPRAQLRPTIYQVKINCTVGGRNYYYETRIDLHTS